MASALVAHLLITPPLSPLDRIRRIGVAIAFNGRQEALLAETARLCKLFGAQPVVIHIGPKAENREVQLDQWLQKQGLPPSDTLVCWDNGEPVEKILEAVYGYSIDLLVAGALQKENLLQYYLGTIARELIRHAPCSVLVLTRPRIETSAFARICAWTGETEDQVEDVRQFSLAFAKRLKAKRLCLVSRPEWQESEAELMEGAVFGPEYSVMRNWVSRELERQNRVASSQSAGELQVSSQLVWKNPEVRLTRLVRRHQADLLIVPASRSKPGWLDKVFRPASELWMTDLPTNVFFLREPR